MWEQIRSNQTRSVVLVAGMGVMLLLIGYLLGIIFFDSPAGGLIIAFIVWGIMSLIAFYQGDSILLGMAGARKISHDDHPRLYNIVEEMKIASGLEKSRTSISLMTRRLTPSPSAANLTRPPWPSPPGYCRN